MEAQFVLKLENGEEIPVGLESLKLLSVSLAHLSSSYEESLSADDRIALAYWMRVLFQISKGGGVQ